MQISIKFELNLTMLDGKAINAITNNTLTRTCYICNATPTQMNQKQVLENLVPDLNSLKFGFSALHAYIRCFECILHISYRLPIKKWQIRGSTAENKCLARKKILQEKFWSKLGLLVDFPKDSGYGNTNDGNTARRAFQNYKVFAEITDVNQELIWRLFNVLCLVNSSYSFNLQKFKVYCDQTYDLYVKEYQWFYMPVSMHKLLVHSAQIIPNFDLPIGFYTEEAQEARNKDNKYIRLNHTRKINRKTTLTDQFNFLHVTSDPVISTLRMSFKRTKKKVRLLPIDAANIAELNLSAQSQDSNEYSDNEEDDETNDEEEDAEIDTEIDEKDLKIQFDVLSDNAANIIVEFDEYSNFFLDE
ncbi:unnamed protein product [Brachionus calyciflorus]|uniref:Uncharacterized protein n=1 Tax=Brachionus calyciflorus TaxID=104777 RepID=A0A814S3L6_9BILA|nr:unnamed protein product [Brachionus calyciflorus]